MTEPRLSSVFDYSDRRLHPNGTRVCQKSTNPIPRIAKAAVLTSRNRWIAKDAGGLANIHKFQNIKETLPDSQGDGEEFVGLRFEADSSKLEDKEEEEEEEEEEEFKAQGKKRKTKRSDGRKAKRRKFLQNYDFLKDDVSSTPNNFTPDAGTKCFPYEPSSDLLKCIHRYASEYYTESGQLLNITRDYRKQRKIKHDKKKAKARAKVSISPTNSQTRPNDDSLGSESDLSPRDGDYGNDSDSEADESKSNEKEKEKPQRKGRQQIAKQYRDMYKVFDGSAIMAIGMFVQEYIAEALDPQVPGEWEEEMRKAFAKECTSEDEGDIVDLDIDNLTGDTGVDSDAEIDSDERDHDHGESSLRNDSEDSEDSNGDSSSSLLVKLGVEIDPHSSWEISDRSLAGRKVSQTLLPDLVDIGLDEDDPIESSSYEIIRSSDTEDAEAEDSD